MLAESVILTGMPGSGKSTIGRYIADRIGADFTDTDDLIAEAGGKALQEIIRSDGLEEFKRLERNVLVGLKPATPMVIATGGSAVLYDDAMLHLKSLGKIVFLDADLPLISKRLWNAESRGIAFEEETEGMSGEERLLKTYMQREPLYYRYCDIRIHIRGRSVSDIAREIIREIG